uniref:Glycoprotein G n=1 Tax=Zeugodacus cucurbitae TaxID=28588 RepID=A0A0A1XNZ6_ZEUCU
MLWAMEPNFATAPIALISLLVVMLSSVKANASIAAANQPAAPNGLKSCNSTRQARMWGDVDPNVFHVCDEATNATRQMRCPAGRGFFNGRGYFGCIPYPEWPACIDRRSLIHSQKHSHNSTSSANATLALCKDELHLQQTWAAVDPNKFYMCQNAESAPLLLNCEAGKGYVSAWVGDGHHGGHGGGHGGEATHIVGCTTWAKWRMYMQCTDFY